MLSSGVFIEGITRQEFLDALDRVMYGVKEVMSRREYGVNELSEITGYSPAHLRKIIRDNSIPYRKTGKQIYVPHESLSMIPRKIKQVI